MALVAANLLAIARDRMVISGIRATPNIVSQQHRVTRVTWRDAIGNMKGKRHVVTRMVQDQLETVMSNIMDLVDRTHVGKIGPGCLIIKQQTMHHTKSALREIMRALTAPTRPTSILVGLASQQTNRNAANRTAIMHPTHGREIPTQQPIYLLNAFSKVLNIGQRPPKTQSLCIGVRMMKSQHTRKIM
jgi:hypothetical protein